MDSMASINNNSSFFKKENIMRRILLGGSFDMFHSGHIEVINKAKTFGDYLVVMLTSDERIRHKKHPALPIYSEQERLIVISNLKAVDEAIIVHGEPGKSIALKGIRLVKPDVYVRTSEVNQKDLADEVALCRELNIEMVILDRQPGSLFRSSSRIIKYILDNFKGSEMEKLVKEDETK
jgi:cytidyltransferase-like protein